MIYTLGIKTGDFFRSYQHKISENYLQSTPKVMVPSIRTSLQIIQEKR